MPLFKRRQEEPGPVDVVLPVYATAKADIYSLGVLIRQGDKIDTRSPLFINQPHMFDFNPEELRKQYGV